MGVNPTAALIVHAVIVLASLAGAVAVAIVNPPSAGGMETALLTVAGVGAAGVPATASVISRAVGSNTP